MKKGHPTRPYLGAWRLHMKKKKIWLANEIGTSHTTVRRHELGELGVDDTTFAAIAKAYGITVEELSVHPSEAAKAQALHRLSKAVQQMDSESIAVLAGLAERMVKEPG